MSYLDNRSNQLANDQSKFSFNPKYSEISKDYSKITFNPGSSFDRGPKTPVYSKFKYSSENFYNDYNIDLRQTAPKPFAILNLGSDQLS